MQQPNVFQNVPTANPVFFQNYSRLINDKKETWSETTERTVKGLAEVGFLTEKEINLIRKMQLEMKSMCSGRWLWTGGTPWIEKPENFYGGYNCSSTNVTDWESFGLLMNLGMTGCGTGAVVEPKYINKLPKICNKVDVRIVGEIGKTPPDKRIEDTHIDQIGTNTIHITVGDSRKGWVDSYTHLLRAAAESYYQGNVCVLIDLENVRPSGEKLKGFGGISNPLKLTQLYHRCAEILNRAVGRKLNSLECCLLIDEAALTVVAGNIRRFAGMKQGDKNDNSFVGAKDNLWQPDSEGNWRIDPKRDALRMSNHTIVYHQKPTLQECIDSVNKQCQSGEGAIQWAGEAVARSNADLFNSNDDKLSFITAYGEGKAKDWIVERFPNISDIESEHRLQRYGLNPCVTGDTWIHTEYGARQVKDLIGQQHSTFVNGELFSTTKEGFFETGEKQVFKLQTKSGFSIKLTEDHKVLKVVTQTSKAQYCEWTQAWKLKPGDKVKLHNHRGIEKWEGQGTFKEGWLLGSMVGDGCITNNKGILRYWGETQVDMLNYALSACKEHELVDNDYKGSYSLNNHHFQITSSKLGKLANKFGIKHQNKVPGIEIEKASYDFYCGFIRGIFDADGSVQGNQNKGVSVRLSQSNLDTLKTIQRMLARLGCISDIYQNRRPEQERLLPDANRELKAYKCKANHELVISKDNLITYFNTIGFSEQPKIKKLEYLLHQYKRPLYRDRFVATIESFTSEGVEKVYDCTVPAVSRFDGNGLVVHNCGEISMSNNFCDLSEIHLNMINPNNLNEQKDAFIAGAINVVGLLHHKFVDSRYQLSRELDPIVGVSFTGLFDFFVNAFGIEWLNWWMTGRKEKWMSDNHETVLLELLSLSISDISTHPEQEEINSTGKLFKYYEKQYLTFWKSIVEEKVIEYCERHKIRQPNRYTVVQPAGTKSLLTNASPGWHPPFGINYIRRITYRKNDAVAKACLDYGYSVIPGQSDKDDEGILLNNPFDERVTEWLVEIPVSVSWSNIEGIENIDMSKISSTAMFDFYMGIQENWTTHNTSSTILLTEDEIIPLATKIFEAIQEDKGYISSALLPRFDAPFPRLPFEKISKDEYNKMKSEVEQRRNNNKTFQELVNYYIENTETIPESACEGMSCILK